MNKTKLVTADTLWCVKTRKRFKYHNIILSERDGWLEVDISTQALPNCIMKIDRIDYDYLKLLGIRRMFPAKHANGSIYAIATFCGKQQSIHRIILSAVTGYVDHINHNTLDNRLSNLRECSNKENSRNRKTNANTESGRTGVYITDSNKYAARIGVDGEKKHLGTFDTFSEACKARRMAELKYFGEFAPQENKENA